MSCNNCGSCCKALVLNISPWDAKKYVRDVYPFRNFTEEDIFNNDKLFIAECLKPISHEEAIKLNPKLKEWILNENDFTYSCTFLTDDNKCKVHDKKLEGHICEGFPFYNGYPSPIYWYSANCGYKLDVED